MTVKIMSVDNSGHNPIYHWRSLDDPSLEGVAIKAARIIGYDMGEPATAREGDIGWMPDKGGDCFYFPPTS